MRQFFYRGSKNTPDHPNANGKLHVVDLNFYNVEKMNRREQYEHLKSGFIPALGMPPSERKAEVRFFERSVAKLDLPDASVVLTVFERFGEYWVHEIYNSKTRLN